MQKLLLMLMMLTLTVALTVPTFADGDDQDGMVTKTFELTINGNGNIPADQQFFVFYRTLEESQVGAPPAAIWFCGPPIGVPPSVPRVSEENCQGNGTVYRYDVAFPQGTQLAFGFAASRASSTENTYFFKSWDGNEPVEREDHETLNADMVNAASFTFPSSTLPETGVSSGATTMVVLSILAANIVLAGYGLRRMVATR